MEAETGFKLIEESAQREGTGSLTRRQVCYDRETKISRWFKKYSKITAPMLITVIVVSITSAILVVIPYQLTGNRKSDLYSRQYTQGDTSLTTIDTRFCTHASIDLEYGNNTKAEVILDTFEKKPNLTFTDTLLAEYPNTQVHRGDSVPVMIAHIHPGSYANWNVCAVWNEGCITKYGHILIFRSQSDFDQWYHPEKSGNFHFAYWHRNIDDSVCTPCCTFQLNYTIESDYYYYIVNTADTNDIICNIEMSTSIIVHRKQYTFNRESHYGCIAYANSTSCKISTDSGPHAVINVINVAGDNIAHWNETVHVSLHCSPNHSLYAVIGVTVCLLVFVMGSLVGFAIFRSRTKSLRKKKSHYIQHIGEEDLDRVGKGILRTDEMDTASATDDPFGHSVPDSCRAPEDVDHRRVTELTSVTDKTALKSAHFDAFSVSVKMPSKAPENEDNRRVEEGIAVSVLQQ